MRAVNLLPREHVEQKREPLNVVALVAGIGGAVVLLVLVGGFLLANRSVDRQRQALTSAKAVLAATPVHQVSAQTQAFRSDVLNKREQRSLARAASACPGIASCAAWHSSFPTTSGSPSSTARCRCSRPRPSLSRRRLRRRSRRCPPH